MDPMQLAQMRRTLEWHAQEIRHKEQELQRVELALEADKKKMGELQRKIAEDKRKLDQMNIDVRKAEDDMRRKIANER